MTTLTSDQKFSGRCFRDRWREHLAGLPPAHAACPPYLVWYRHPCAERGSWALFLRQHYRTSPDGLFAFIYRQGTCSHCDFSVRSTGRLVLAEGNPPEKGAKVLCR